MTISYLRSLVLLLSPMLDGFRLRDTVTTRRGTISSTIIVVKMEECYLYRLPNEVCCLLICIDSKMLTIAVALTSPHSYADT